MECSAHLELLCAKIALTLPKDRTKIIKRINFKDPNKFNKDTKKKFAKILLKPIPKGILPYKAIGYGGNFLINYPW